MTLVSGHLQLQPSASRPAPLESPVQRPALAPQVRPKAENLMSLDSCDVLRRIHCLSTSRFGVWWSTFPSFHAHDGEIIQVLRTFTYYKALGLPHEWSFSSSFFLEIQVCRHYIVDATSEEESQMNFAVSISINRKGHRCGLIKRGDAGMCGLVFLFHDHL